MSGVDNWAMIEPSTYSTIEWTTLCGCTTTWTRGISMSKSHRASIISKPLLNSVAESMVILRPMTHEGCLSACSTVTASKASFGHFAASRNGPPEAVSHRLRTDEAGLPSRHWKMAECSLSTASTRTPWARASRMTVSPAITRISLEATAMSLPARMAAKAGSSPAVPTMAMSTMSASGRVARRIRASGPASTSVALPRAACTEAALLASWIETMRGRCLRPCSISRSALPPAAKPTNWRRSGWSSTTFRVLVPIEPVQPSRTTRFMCRPSLGVYPLLRQEPAMRPGNP